MKSVFRHCRFGWRDATVHVGLRELVFGVLCKHPRAGDRLLARWNPSAHSKIRVVGRHFRNWPLSEKPMTPSFTVY
jgi:hypothetical protein